MGRETGSSGLIAFREKWRDYQRDGTVASYHQLGMRQLLIDRVKRDLQRALAPPPTRRYQEIPERRSVRDDPREPWERIDNPFLYETRTQRCLAYIESFRPTQQEGSIRVP